MWKTLNIRQDADFIIRESIKKVLPNEAVLQALKEKTFPSGNIYVVAAGKAAWEMANTASAVLQKKITASHAKQIQKQHKKRIYCF